MFKKTLSAVIFQRMHQCSDKMQDWWSRGSWFDSGSMQFFCVFIFLFFLFFCSFYFCVLFIFVFFFFLSSIKRQKAKECICYLTICHRYKCGVCDTHNSRERFLMNFIIVSLYNHYLSHDMRKLVYAICEQQRRISTCTCAQSDQRLCCCIISN